MNQSGSGVKCGLEATELAILLWAAAVGTSFFTLAPALVGGLIDHVHLSVRQVGLISSGELAGSALGGALVLVYGRLFSTRATLTGSLVLAGVCNFTTAATHDFGTIALCRVVAGLGGGLAFSLVNAAAARAQNPGHMFAAISVVQTVFGIAGFIGLPALIGSVGLSAVFILLGMCSLGCAIAAALGVTTAPIYGSPLRASLSITPRGALLLSSLFATYLTSTAIWTYMERIGVAARLTGEVISVGLSIAMVSSALGSLGATVLLIRARDMDRFVVGGVAIMVLSTGLLLKAAVPAAYWAALLGFNGALALVTPLYLTKLATETGGDSRILVAMMAMYLGLILGPLLGAGLVAGGAYEALIHVGAGLFLAATLLALSSSRLGPHPASTIRWIQGGAPPE
jgi:predicted MFS family arabinose efflux permease